MNKFYTLLLGFLFIGFNTTLAQQQVNCGMTHTDMEKLAKRVVQHKKAIKNGEVPRYQETIFVPIKFHIMANNGGIGGVKESILLQTLCRINEDFADQEIQFFLEGDFNYINNTSAFENPSTPAGELFLANAKSQNFGRMNIFVCRNAGDIANVGTVAGYYRPSSDWIVVRKANVGYFEGTLTHEIGHFLSLMHVFYGWDANPYNPALHSNPAPTFSPNGPVTENNDRTGSCANCETAGDMLCDTWPDYLLSQFYSNGNCTYTGDIKDPCGVLVEPAKENVMSYFFGCEEVFTDQQKGLMAADLNMRFNNATINKNLAPDNKNQIDSSEPIVLLEPLNEEDLAHHSVVFLGWEPILNATQYIVEIDEFDNFNVNPQKVISSYPGASFDNLKPNDRYFWRVYPFNQYSTCYGWSQIYTFNTGEGTTAIEGIEEIESWQINPNPLRSDQRLTIQLNAAETMDTQLSIMDISGKTLKQFSSSIQSGQNQIQIDTQDLIEGIYIISLQTDNGVLTKKLIVSN